MKHHHLIVLTCILFLTLQCKKQDQLPECPNCNFTCLPDSEPGVVTNDCMNNFTCTFGLHPDSKLAYTDDDFDNYIKSGGKLVFRMRLRTEGEAHIADDEFTDLLFFEIDQAQESFSAEGSELDLLNVRFQQLCFCADVKTKKPVSGCMQGQKIDDEHWRVQADLTIQYPSWTKEMKVDAVFKK
jgi:hypothetical protein